MKSEHRFSPKSDVIMTLYTLFVHKLFSDDEKMKSLEKKRNRRFTSEKFRNYSVLQCFELYDAVKSNDYRL